MDTKFEYFMQRTQEDFRELKASFEEINEKLDILNEWKIKVDTKNAIISSLFGGGAALIVMLVEIYLKGHSA